MKRRAVALLLVVGAIVAAASLSAPASGAGDQAQFAAWSYDGSICSGFVLETLAGVVTGCRTIPPDLQGGTWSIAADGSMVGGGQEVGPVTLIKPNDQAVVLDSNPNNFNAAISPDGSKVAFMRAVPQKGMTHTPTNLFVINTDGTGLKEIASGRGSLLRDPTFSPDSKTIAYSCEPAIAAACGPLPDGSNREFALLLINADGSNQRVFVINQNSQQMSWSADGKEIATESVGPCTCDGKGPANTEIYVYHTDGSDLFNGGDGYAGVYPLPRLKVTHENDFWGALWPQFVGGSSDQLVYERSLPDGVTSYSINLDGTGRQKLPLFSSDDPYPHAADYGLVIPAASGASAPPFVNVMRVRVPALRRLAIRAARQRLQAAGLAVGKINYEYSARPKNSVVAQLPAGGAYAHRVSRQRPPVRLTLSRGPAPG